MFGARRNSLVLDTIRALSFSAGMWLMRHIGRASTGGERRPKGRLGALSRYSTR
jgi:hypothetical protein